LANSMPGALAFFEWRARSTSAVTSKNTSGSRVQRKTRSCGRRSRHGVNLWRTARRLGCGGQKRQVVGLSPTRQAFYKQADLPSMETILSFHIGLTARLVARSAREASATDEQQDRTPAAWRKFAQAAEAIDKADEAEEFQAVGMRCRARDESSSPSR
jgi:hypothetical protein